MCFAVVVFTAIYDICRKPFAIVFLSNRTFACLNKRLNFITQLSCYALSSDFVLLLWINHSFHNIWNFFLLVFLPTRAKRLVKTIGDVSISIQKHCSVAEKRPVEQVTILFTPKSFWAEFFSQKPCISGYHVKITVIFRDNPYAQTDWSFKNRSACNENNPLFSSLQSHLKIVVRLNGMRLLLLDCLYQLFAVSAFRSVGKHIFTSVPQKIFWGDFRQSKTSASICIGRAAQANQKISDSFNLSFCRCLCSGVLCASENTQPSEYSEWIYSCRGPYIPSMYDSQAS